MLKIFKNLTGLKLHTKILIALIAGALFGAVFNVDRHRVQIAYGIDGEVKTVEVRDWERITVYAKERKSFYGRSEQDALLRYFDRLKPSERRSAAIEVVFGDPEIEEPSLQRYETIRTANSTFEQRRT